MYDFFFVHAARSCQLNYAYGMDHHLNMLEKTPKRREIGACHTSKPKLADLVFNPCDEEHGRIHFDR